MGGQLGVMFQDGKQIGGFLDWDIQVDLRPGNARELWKGYKSPKWKAQGKRPWLLKKPASDVLDVVFYNFIRGKLIENHRDKAKALLPSSYPLNEYLEFTVILEKV